MDRQGFFKRLFGGIAAVASGCMAGESIAGEEDAMVMYTVYIKYGTKGKAGPRTFYQTKSMSELEKEGYRPLWPEEVAGQDMCGWEPYKEKD